MHNIYSIYVHTFIIFHYIFLLLKGNKSCDIEILSYAPKLPKVPV